MPRGTEPTPREYARLVAKTMKAIAADRGTSGRALAKQMGVGEKYLRDRFLDDPAAAFTIGDVERFALVYRFDPAWFLADPVLAREFLLEEMLNVGVPVDAKRTDYARAASKTAPKTAPKPSIEDNTP